MFGKMFFFLSWRGMTHILYELLNCITILNSLWDLIFFLVECYMEEKYMEEK